MKRAGTRRSQRGKAILGADAGFALCPLLTRSKALLFHLPSLFLAVLGTWCWQACLVVVSGAALQLGAQSSPGAASPAERGSRCTGFGKLCFLGSVAPSTWVLPRSGIEPVSPALAGGFFTPEPPGKPLASSLTGPSLCHHVLYVPCPTPLWTRYCVSRSVMPDSPRPHGLYVVCQAPLSMGFSR